jgi:transposase InsO family protein
MDLADVSSIHSHNQNYKYLLFVIDVFSRYLWIQPIKDKTSKSVINALKIVLRSRKPNSIKSDKGSEFKNKEVRSFLKKEDIHTFYSQNETKGALVERSIRTIKTALYRYFSHKQTYKYLDVLQDFVRNYNKKNSQILRHRWTKTMPAKSDIMPILRRNQGLRRP